MGAVLQTRSEYAAIHRISTSEHTLRPYGLLHVHLLFHPLCVCSLRVEYSAVNIETENRTSVW